MMNHELTKHIHIQDYDYPLPDERIAKYPLAERDSSKLLLYRHGEVSEDVFHNIANYLPKGALMVFNNTKVIQARLHFRKNRPLPAPLKGGAVTNAAPESWQTTGQTIGQTNSDNPQGALIEVFLLEPAYPIEYQENFASKGSCSWYCLVGNLKKWKTGSLTRIIDINGQQVQLSATRGELHGTSHTIHFEWHTIGNESQRTNVTAPPFRGAGRGLLSFAEILDAMGELPIPPYLNRETEESDKTTYQTVYSKIKGSVAAPTAGLHFTERVLADLDQHGIDREEVTLHVGAGTFKPVKSEEIGGHDMHTEHIAVRRESIEKLIQHGGEAIAVGTTSVRTLESLYYMGILAAPLLSPQGGKTPSIEAASLSPLEESEGAEELHVPQWMPYEYAEQCEQEGRQPMSTIEALQNLLRYMDERHMPVLHSSTQIIIAPGYNYHIVKRMVTNFHQPKSTLLLLVSAFVHGDWHCIYDYALSHDFRFLSYGDSSLLIPDPS